MTKKRIILIFILVITITKVVSCVRESTDLNDKISSSSQILNTVKEFEKLLGASILKQVYLCESAKDYSSFKPSEERVLLQQYTFEINDRELISELIMYIDEFIYVYNNKYDYMRLEEYDKRKLEEIKSKIIEIKEIVVKWREDNRHRSMFID
ncbi:MAG: hypothetical protein ACRC7N_07685 [Clostridium sp.]